jgi:hypothetical protein
MGQFSQCLDWSAQSSCFASTSCSRRSGTESDDVRHTLQQTFADCTMRLAELDQLLGVDPS